MRIEPFYDRADLINATTETVEENLLVGIMLVTVILLMFLSNVRSALIIALESAAWRCCLPLARCTSATNRRTCCRSAPSTSASSSIRP